MFSMTKIKAVNGAGKAFFIDFQRFPRKKRSKAAKSIQLT